MENRFLEEAEYIEGNWNGDPQELKDFSARAASESFQAARALIAEIKGTLKTSDLDRMLLSYFTQVSDGCGMPYDRAVIK